MAVAEGIAALKSLKSLYEIAREVKDSNDPDKLRAAASQMLDLALAAREQTAALQEERNEALRECAQVNEELKRVKSWECETQRYELKSVESGMFVYMLKAAERGTAPPHWLCPNCFEDGKKSLFQKPQISFIAHICSRCNSKISVDAEPTWLD